MARKHTGKPRLHKKSGRAFVELGGKRVYLEATFGTRAAQQEYDRLYGQWLANGKKPPPSKDTEVTGITCNELVIHYLDEMEEYHVKQRRTYLHCCTATALLTKHYGSELAANFTPLSLKFIRRKFVEHGYVRKKVNYYVNLIKDAFALGVTDYGVPAPVHHALLSVKSLKEEKTKARESTPFTSVSDEKIEKVKAEMPEVIQDMTEVQWRCCMRAQDVCNLRLCDIDCSGKVWKYTPFTHKNKSRGKDLVKHIGAESQAILMKYIGKRNDPQAFLFSPKDLFASNHKHKGRLPGDKFTPSSYGKEIAKACEAVRIAENCKLEEVKWTSHQLRCAAITKARDKFGLDVAQAFAGHIRRSSTEGYAPVNFDKALDAAEAFG